MKTYEITLNRTTITAGKGDIIFVDSLEDLKKVRQKKNAEEREFLYDKLGLSEEERYYFKYTPMHLYELVEGEDYVALWNGYNEWVYMYLKKGDESI